MDTTKELMRRQILSWGRGRIFFTEDFTDVGSDVSIRQALSSLTSENFIARMARGVYCFPRVAGEYSMTTIYPAPDTVAEAVAARAGARIVPSGERAAYIVGFTSLQMSRNEYLTDGAPRVIHMKDGKVVFHHTSETRIFLFQDATMQLLSLAMREIGMEACEDPGIRRAIIDNLSKVKDSDFQHDIKLCPAWVGEILLSI